MEALALTLIVFALAGFFAFRWVKKRAADMSGLLSTGATVTGKVVMAQRIRRSRTYEACMLRYSFVAGNGIEYEREIELKPRDFALYSEGQAINIVYDPSNPDNSMLQGAVKEARAASRRAP